MTMTEFLNIKISQKQIVCPKHGTHKHYISSDIEGYQGNWCMLCWLESLGPSLSLTAMMKMIDPIYNDTAEQPLIRQLQLNPSLYCLMATDEQAALMINVIADAIEYEGLSGTTVDWLRTQAGETK
jgi:hypothetical protein